MSLEARSPALRVASLLAGVGIVVLGLVTAPPEGLSVEGWRAILLMCGAITLWVFQPIDLAATALLGMAGIPLLGILPPGQAFELFGNQAVFFVLGVFVIAAVLMHTGLATRAALTLLSRFDRSPSLLAGAVLIASVLGCAVLVSHAVAAILFPILLEICRSLGLVHGKSRYARRLLLSMAWGTIVGSNLTFLSSVRVGLALGLLAQHEARTAEPSGIDFLFWVTTAIGIVAIMTVAVGLVLAYFHPAEELEMGPAVELLRRRVADMGPISYDELIALTSIAAMLAGMVFWGQQLGFGTIAILAAGLNFLSGSVPFAAAEKYVSWGIVLLFGGAVAMASAIEHTGGVEWVANHVLPQGEVHPLVLIGIVAYLCVILTEFASNSAVIAALLPVCLVLADRVGLPGKAMVFATVIPSGLAFMLPTATPAMAMVYSSGYLRSEDTVFPGLVLIHLGWVVLMLFAWLMWPAIGLR